MELVRQTVAKILREWNNFQTHQKDKRGRRTSISSNQAMQILNTVMTQDPTLSISEKIKRTKEVDNTFNFSVSQVYYFMKKNGYSYKRCRIHPLKRKLKLSKIKRLYLAMKFLDLLENDKEIINIDEFHIAQCNRNYGWSKIGVPCVKFQDFKNKHCTLF